MKNSKETRFLLILLAFALLYVYYTYLLKPIMASNKDLESKLETEETQVKSMYTMVGNYGDNLQTLNEHKDALQKQADLFYGADSEQEDFINLLHGLFTSENLQLVSITSADYFTSLGNDFPGTFSPYLAYYPEAQESTSSADTYLLQKLDEVASEGRLPYLDAMDITFKYTGGYDEIQNFLKKLEQTKKYTTCSDIEIKLVSGANYYNADTEKDLVAVVSFLRPQNLVALDTEPEDLTSVVCVMPRELADGSYRDMHSLSNYMEAIKAIFTRE